jgi:hypothetical protein
MTRPFRLAGTAALFLTLGLACFAGPDADEQAEAADDGAPSLGDLLGAAPPPATEPSAVPALPDLEEPPPLPDLGSPLATDEPEVQETAECTQARAELRSQREAVDARRTREIQAAERALASGQLAMQNCIKTSPCNEDATLMAAAQEKEEAAESAYQAAMARVAEVEAGLFQYEQAVDRACGRR